MNACAMCGASDCVQLRAQVMDVCPVYYRLRDALLPAGGDLSGPAALALFWMAAQVGRAPLAERLNLAGDLVDLFTFAHDAAKGAKSE